MNFLKKIIVLFSVIIFCETSCHDNHRPEERKIESPTSLEKSTIENKINGENLSHQDHDAGVERDEQRKFELIKKEYFLEQDSPEKQIFGISEFIFGVPLVGNTVSALTLHKQGILFVINNFEGQGRTSIISLNFLGKQIFKRDFVTPRTSTYILSLEDFFITYSVGLPHSPTPQVTIEGRSYRTGSTIWKKVLDGSTDLERRFQLQPSVDEKRNIIYIPHEKDKISAYKLSQPGKPLWTYTAKNTIQCSPIVDRSGHIFTCLIGRKIVKIDENGKVVWEFQPVKPLVLKDWANLSMVGSNLLYRDGGEISFFDVKAKKLLWRSSEVPFQFGAVSSNRKIILNTRGRILVFNTEGKKIKHTLPVYGSFLPLLQDNGRMLTLSDVGVVYLDSVGNVISKYQHPTIAPVRRSYGNHSLVMKDDGYLFFISKNTETEQIGISKIKSSLPSISISGWPHLDGNQMRTRAVKQ